HLDRICERQNDNAGLLAFCREVLRRHPGCALALARLLPGTPELQRVLVLEAAMPAAVFPIVMARQYGGDVATALQVVLSTSVVSLVTMPLWIRAGLAWIGGGAGF
ncbi:MAG: AEC family transporter, partial [Limisphaera sp.]|nr:AEC family transporter [Limisphaera sp.]